MFEVIHERNEPIPFQSKLVKTENTMMISKEVLELYSATIKHFVADEIIFYEGKECQYYHQLASGIVR